MCFLARCCELPPRARASQVFYPSTLVVSDLEGKSIKALVTVSDPTHAVANLCLSPV